MGMVSALCVLLLLICSPQPTAAQSTPLNSNLQQPSLENSAPPAKLFELPRDSASRGFGGRTFLTNDPTIRQRVEKFLSDQQEGTGAMGIQSPVAASGCAHILIYEAPSVDSKMIIEVPKEFNSNMPKLEGLQPCLGDLRKLVIPQLAPLNGSGRIGQLAPKPEVPQGGIQP
jgi:hypothetical protein